MRRLAVLLSGRGSNFEAIADAVKAGRIPESEIVAVISDVAGARGLERARERGLPAVAVERGRFASRAEHEREIARILREAGTDLVCLAGYMRVLSPEFVRQWPGRILNIHPSLLPKYRGLSPQRRALEAGEVEAGCTVHVVDEGTDTGPVVLQRKVPVAPDDTEETLSARILEQEHEAYPDAIAKVLDGLETPWKNAPESVHGPRT
jgi:phosphoribosylglycinamide formyltransferase-1